MKKSTPKRKKYMRDYMRERRKDPTYKMYKRMWTRMSRGSALPVNFPPLRIKRNVRSKYAGTAAVSSNNRICFRCECLLKDGDGKYCSYCLRKMN